MENLESPGISFSHFQEWKVLEKDYRPREVLEICLTQNLHYEKCMKTVRIDFGNERVSGEIPGKITLSPGKVLENLFLKMGVNPVFEQLHALN